MVFASHALCLGLVIVILLKTEVDDVNLVPVLANVSVVVKALRQKAAKLLESGKVMKGWPSIRNLGWPGNASALKSMEDVKDLLIWFFTVEHHENLKLCNLNFEGVFSLFCEFPPYLICTMSRVESLNCEPIQLALSPRIIYVDGTPTITVGDVSNWQNLIKKHLKTGSQSKSMALKQKHGDTSSFTMHKAKVIKALGKLEHVNVGHPRSAPIPLASAASIRSDVEPPQSEAETSEADVITDDSAQHPKQARTAAWSPSVVKAISHPGEHQH